MGAQEGTARRPEAAILPTINLPPASLLYVIILTGVPEINNGQRETQLDLRNKCLFWLARYRQFPYDTAGEILMVRRVGWLGKRQKNNARVLCSYQF